MRVHPIVLAPKAARWHFPLAFGLLFLLLVVTVLRGPRKQVVADQPAVKMVQVLVAKKTIEPGQPLDKTAFALEKRPINTLPADAITSLDVVKDKVAAGPIPAGYPLAVTLLADPVPVVATSAGAPEDVVEDPVETLLKELEKDTVAIPLRFTTEAPPRGTRVVVMVPGFKGQPTIVAEDAWVIRGSGREATIRLDPAQALVLHVAKARSDGQFAFIEIAADGVSPYAGKGVTTEEELRKALDGTATKSVSASEGKEKAPYKGYAWVSGEGVRYGVDEGGKLHAIDGSQGSQPSTLHDQP